MDALQAFTTVLAETGSIEKAISSAERTLERRRLEIPLDDFAAESYDELADIVLEIERNIFLDELTGKIEAMSKQE